MRHAAVLEVLGLVLALGLGVSPRGARAQVSLADDIILASKGGEEEKGLSEQGEETKLGVAPGSNAGPFRNSPGSAAVLLGTEVVPVPASVGVPGSASPLNEPGRGMQEPGRGLAQAGERLGIAPSGHLQPTEASTFGIHELPGDDAGPAGGLTLDEAIDRLIRTNLDLRTKAFEIPMARADVLTSGLRTNPLFFYDTTQVPYGSYSRQRPGDIDSAVSIVYPIDYSGKRRARIVVAQQAQRVLEAQYQDAVRIAIDNLYTAYVDVLSAREAVRAARDSFARLDRFLGEARRRAEKGQASRDDFDSLALEHSVSALLVETESDRLRATKRTLATLLNLPADAAECLDPSGSLSDRSPPPPSLDALLAIACTCRPDLAAHRLGIDRARADVALARADRFTDAYLLYTPFGYRDHSQEGAQSSSSWGAGVFVSLPIYNRNQGNIARARLNVDQSASALEHRERQVFDEVRKAFEDYEGTRRHLQRLATEIYPAIRRKRDLANRRFEAGTISADALLNVLRDHSSVVRHYRAMVVRHRRSMLALDTAVGQRILP